MQDILSHISVVHWHLANQWHLTKVVGAGSSLRDVNESSSGWDVQDLVVTKGNGSILEASRHFSTGRVLPTTHSTLVNHSAGAQHPVTALSLEGEDIEKMWVMGGTMKIKEGKGTREMWKEKGKWGKKRKASPVLLTFLNCWEHPLLFVYIGSWGFFFEAECWNLAEIRVWECKWEKRYRGKGPSVGSPNLNGRFKSASRHEITKAKSCAMSDVARQGGLRFRHLRKNFPHTFIV